MTRQPHVARRAEELLGTAVAATAPVAGGDIATATKLRLSSGRSAFMKTLTNAPPGFFETEAAGLRWLGEAGGVTVPEVLAVETDCLILAWVEPGKLTTEAAGEFGAGPGADPRRRCAVVRAGARRDSSAGCRCPTRARRRGRSSTRPSGSCPTSSSHATGTRSRPNRRRRSRAWSGRFADLVPEEGPRRLHGDLWNGNVIWTHDGGCCVIDPAAHGGHRETDLAMLAALRAPPSATGAAGLRGGLSSRRGLGRPGRCPSALPAARARLPVRRRVRRPRGRGRRPLRLSPITAHHQHPARHRHREQPRGRQGEAARRVRRAPGHRPAAPVTRPHSPRRSARPSGSAAPDRRRRG